MSNSTTPSSLKIPEHVAIIMDGNGRWAQLKGKPRTFGHKNGVKSVQNSLEFAGQIGIKYLTLFAFSSENWKRPETEVGVLMELFFTTLTGQLKRLKKNNVRLRFIGDLSAFSERLQKKMAESVESTSANTGLTVNIAVNYGGRWDIVNAAKQAILSGAFTAENIDQLDEECFSRYTQLGDIPNPDLFIRTGGDHRISNFLIWDLAYTELYFTQTLWPDFDSAHFMSAVESYSNRQRRFGMTGDQVEGKKC